MSISFGFKKLCWVSAISVMAGGLTQTALADLGELVVATFTTAEGTYATDLYNGGTNDGTISILGNDAKNNLIISAVGSNGNITQSPQNALSISTASTTWWTNGGYMDLVFNIDGTGTTTGLPLGTQVQYIGGLMKHWNSGAIDNGETMEIWNMSVGTPGIGELIRTVTLADMAQNFGITLQVTNIAADLPLGDTIRFKAVNTVGGWPQDTWAAVQFVFDVFLPGDLDVDGFVGIADLNIVLSNWNSVPAFQGDGQSGDPSNDNFVGIEDLNTVLGNWNNGTPPSPAAVPEPASLALLSLSGFAMLKRSR